MSFGPVLQPPIFSRLLHLLLLKDYKSINIETLPSFRRRIAEGFAKVLWYLADYWSGYNKSSLTKTKIDSWVIGHFYKQNFNWPYLGEYLELEAYPRRFGKLIV